MNKAKPSKLRWSSPVVYNLKFGDTSGSGKRFTGPAIEVHTASSTVEVHDTGTNFHVAAGSSGVSNPIAGKKSTVRASTTFGPS